MHVRLNICSISGQAAGPYCPSVVSRVFLVKKEEITQTDAYGKTVKRYYHTADSPYVLTSLVQTPCRTHLSYRAPVRPKKAAESGGGESIPANGKDD